MRHSLPVRFAALLAVGGLAISPLAYADPVTDAMAATKYRTGKAALTKLQAELGWAGEKSKRDKAGITAKTATANAFLARAGKDKGSKLLSAHRAALALPKNDGLFYAAGGQTYHFRNCALDTLAGIEGGSATSTRAALTWQKLHSGKVLASTEQLALHPALQYENLFIIVRYNLHDKRIRGGVVQNPTGAPPDKFFDYDAAKKNRMVTQAQLKGLIEYLLDLRDRKPAPSYATGVQFLISQQGYPDLLPSDPDKPSGYAGDDLGDLYDLHTDPGKNRLLQLMKTYPNGTRYAVFLYGKGSGVGDQHWLYAEKFNDKVVFRDFQKSLKVSDTEAWEPTAYLEETPLTPVGNHAGVFSKGMFLAYVPVFPGEDAGAIKKTIAAAAETRKAAPTQFHDSVPTEWKARVVALDRKVSDAMLGVINASIPALFKAVGVSRADPPKLAWEKNYFELDTPLMGLAMLYCDNADEAPTRDVLLKSIYASASKAGVKLHEDKTLQGQLSGARDNREKTTRVIRYLWKMPAVFGKIVGEMRKNSDLRGRWDGAPAAKRCANVLQDGKQAVYMHARNGQTDETFFYTALHEFMHLTSGSPEGLMDWTPPALLKVAGDGKAGTDLFDLRNNLNEGFTDLFADLAACYVRKYKAASMPGLVPPEDRGLRAYTYLRQAVMNLAEKLETTAVTPPNPLLQGVKALAGIYFKADWASLAKQIKTDATRPNPAFFGHVKNLSLYPTAYEGGTALAALTALKLPKPAALKTTADRGVKLCTDLWGFTAPTSDCASVLDGATGSAVESSVKGYLECLAKP